jgi:hypothetical protein
MSRPTPLYTSGLDLMQKLIHEEGIHAAEALYADVLGGPRKQQFARDELAKPQRGPHVCVHRLVGAAKCLEMPPGICDTLTPTLPASDHLSEWRSNAGRGGKTVAIVSQPYSLSNQDLQEIVSRCQSDGLQAEVSTESWHFPGRSLLLTWRSGP